jgi:hypothetical protein
VVSPLTMSSVISRASSKKLVRPPQTGAELHSLTGAMNEIYETLGGSVDSSVFPTSALPSLTRPVLSLNTSLHIRDLLLSFFPLNSPTRCERDRCCARVHSDIDISILVNVQPAVAVVCRYSVPQSHKPDAGDGSTVEREECGLQS